MIKNVQNSHDQDKESIFNLMFGNRALRVFCTSPGSYLDLILDPLGI